MSLEIWVTAAPSVSCGLLLDGIEPEVIRTPSAHLTEDRELADRGNMTIHMNDGSVDLGGRHRTVPFPLDKKKMK